MLPLLLITLAAMAGFGQAAPSAVWLDRPLVNWNAPGTAVPAPPSGDESRAGLIARCSWAVPENSLAAGAVTAAG